MQIEIKTEKQNIFKMCIRDRLIVGLIIVGICFVAVPITDIMNIQPATQGEMCIRDRVEAAEVVKP